MAIGIAGSLWAGFGVVLATQHALERVWGVARPQRPGFLASRLRALALLALLGALTIASTVASGLVGGGSGLLGPVGGIAISLANNHHGIIVNSFHREVAPSEAFAYVKSMLNGRTIVPVNWTPFVGPRVVEIKV